MESSNIEWELYIERLQHYYGENAIESYERRIESELKCVGRLVNNLISPPVVHRHLTANHHTRRKTVFKCISRCFDIVDEMNRLIKERS